MHSKTKAVMPPDLPLPMERRRLPMHKDPKSEASAVRSTSGSALGMAILKALDLPVERVTSVTLVCEAGQFASAEVRCAISGHAADELAEVLKSYEVHAKEVGPSGLQCVIGQQGPDVGRLTSMGLASGAASQNRKTESCGCACVLSVLAHLRRQLARLVSRSMRMPR